MALNVLELVTAKNMAVKWDSSLALQDYLLVGKKFPVTEYGQLELSMIKGNTGLPLVLEPSAFDTDPNARPRIGIRKVEGDMPFFREEMVMDETDLNRIQRFLNSNELTTAQAIVRQIFDDAGELIRGGKARQEQMAWQLILNGAIAVTADLDNGRSANYEVSYDPDGSWAANNKVELLTTSKWTDPLATPLADLEEMLDKAEEDGVVIDQIVMNKATFNTFINHASVKALVNPTSIWMNSEQYRAAVEGQLGVSFVIYNASYRMKDNTDGTVKTYKFIPDGMVSFQPAGNFGRLLVGTTPHQWGEAVLRNPLAEAARYQGMTIIRHTEGSVPVKHKTVAEMVAIPSFEAMDSVYVLKAY